MVRDSTKPPVRGKTSPYGFFVKMCYEEHKKKYPNENVQVTEISKKCSEKWKTMTDDEKRRFYELAQKDAERYQAEVAAYGGEEALRKRKRAKKDPNAPKRALSAFFFFSSDRRPEVQQGHPEWKVGQVAQELGRVWKDLTEEDKKKYEVMAVKDKARYEVEMREYKTTGKKPASRMTPAQLLQAQADGTHAIPGAEPSAMQAIPGGALLQGLPQQQLPGGVPLPAGIPMQAQMSAMAAAAGMPQQMPLAGGHPGDDDIDDDEEEEGDE